ncbi:unnamed protein product [Polarella glacialis]|uniref:Uncharacterized protein n=1 Tax=Polarella glacialis TaxID=89957 RepID=A0A813ETW7_POLGL|nr:unnamed protein product [Polarella glacialis]
MSHNPTTMARPMAASVIYQPWVRGPPSRRARVDYALEVLQGRSGWVEEGDKVQICRSPLSPVDGVVEQIVEEGDGSANSPIALKVRTSIGLDAVLGSCVRKAAKISVIAPGAGLGSVGSIYADLGRDSRFQVQVVGKKGVNYDRYPLGWETGSSPPNLASFGTDIARIGIPERTDCFIFGSRGGQAVLPVLWQALGDSVPPSVVINGGCAMNLPGSACRWPQHAVTLMLLGGQDYFRGSSSAEEYLQQTCRCVPTQNRTTALIYLPEMKHMPQKEVLDAMMFAMVLAALSWQESPQHPPLGFFRAAMQALEQEGFGGRLLYTVADADTGSWRELIFGPQVRDRPPQPPSPRAARAARAPPPPGTAVSVMPIEVALAQTPQSHREAAAQARRMVKELTRMGVGESAPCNGAPFRWELRVAPQAFVKFGLESRLQCQRLLEFADGQECEAYAAEDELPQPAYTAGRQLAPGKLALGEGSSTPQQLIELVARRRLSLAQQPQTAQPVSQSAWRYAQELRHDLPHMLPQKVHMYSVPPQKQTATQASAYASLSNTSHHKPSPMAQGGHK